VHPIYRTGIPLPSKCFILYIFSTNISPEYFKHAAHSPFFSSKCRLFHNATFSGSCIIHILHTGVLKFKCKTPVQKVKNAWAYCTVLFPCGDGRVASLLLSKLVGLDHRVIYVGVPWKARNQLRLADTLIHTQFRVLSLILFVKLQCLLRIWSRIFV